MCLYYQLKRESFISFSKYKYTGIKEGEMQTISEKRKTDNGLGGLYPQMLVYIEHPGLRSLPSNYRRCNAGAQQCANKRRHPCGHSAQPISILLCKEGRKESPAEWGTCQASGASVSQRSFPWHSVWWGGMIGGHICKGRRDGLTGKKQIQPLGMLSWALFI